MAVAFSAHPLSFTPPSPTFSSQNPSKTLQPKPSTFPTIRPSHLLHYNSKPILGFRISRPSFKSQLQTSDTEERDQIKRSNLVDETEQRHLSDLKTLIEAYKEAFHAGDEKRVTEIEALIYIKEAEKNELAAKVAILSSDVASEKEKYIRLQADFENFRKRTEKDRLTLTSNAQGELIERLLPIVDNFERAKQQIRPETDKGKKIDTSYQGIYKQFVEVMRSLHVAVIETVGTPFDPSLHEAITREESQEFKKGIIIQEVRRGFLLQGKLLRPALVKVSIGCHSQESSCLDQGVP